MKRLAIAAMALAVLGSSAAHAQPAPAGDQQRAPETNVQQPATNQQNAQQRAPDQRSDQGDARQGGPDRRNAQRPAAPSPEDAAAYLDARVAALHSGLQLTPDQERLWPPFEKAYREFARLRVEQTAAPAGAENDLPARVERRADVLIRRGMALKALAEAGAPLWRSLDEAQKRRFVTLIRENFVARFTERVDRGLGGRQGLDRGPGNFEDRNREGNFGPRQFRFGGRDGGYGERREFAPRDDGGRRGFDNPGREGNRFGLEGPRGYERRDFGPRDFGSRDFGLRDFGRQEFYRRDFGPRDFGPRDFGPRGFGRDGDGYGFPRRGFGRDDDSRDFAPRDFGPRSFGPRD